MPMCCVSPTRVLQIHRHAGWPRPLCVAAAATGALVLLAPVAALPPAHAASVNPLPATARALAAVTSYQVTITASTSGARRPSRARGTRGTHGTRRSGGFFPGRGTETIVAVRAGHALTEDVVFHVGNTSSPATMELLIAGSRVCRRLRGAHSFTCQSGATRFNPDPTLALEGSAAGVTFTPRGTRTLAGQRCLAYAYVTKTAAQTASGTLYVAQATHLPCEQDARVTRRAFSGRGTFTQESVIVWSHFDDPHLRVPMLPKA